MLLVGLDPGTRLSSVRGLSWDGEMLHSWSTAAGRRDGQKDWGLGEGMSQHPSVLIPPQIQHNTLKMSTSNREHPNQHRELM